MGNPSKLETVYITDPATPEYCSKWADGTGWFFNCMSELPQIAQQRRRWPWSTGGVPERVLKKLHLSHIYLLLKGLA